jgi:hypothetical protein
VKATLWEEVPKGGVSPGELKAKIPGTEEEPPLREELVRD